MPETNADDNEPNGGIPSMTGSRRIAWAAMPTKVKASIEELLGSTVVNAVSQPGGFSEGVAARLHLATGQNVFLKAVNSLTAPDVARFHRQEGSITQRLPSDVPVPRLLHIYDDGTWVALLFEYINGSLPAQPWRGDELNQVLTTVTAMALALTPSPISASAAAQPRLGGWSHLAAPTQLTTLTRLSPWAAEHLNDLIRMETAAAETISGDTLLHGDLYPFNILLTAASPYVIDWPHAWVGPRHCDVLTVMSTAVTSGLDPEPFVESNPLTRHLHPYEIDTYLTAHAGFLARLAITAGPAADPHLINMATALGQASLRWLRRRRR
ncbi:aminoglycoside phosphotransferase family protein [Micromonospora sp. NPDC092111]|uniref:aminoglycoside phosphotransferase family protein n=1 Tax=Micromonospora sp. NPDC092111 TaxID=3364289 RepID=UPI00381C954B